MPQFHSNNTAIAEVLQPPCPDCGMPMWLTGLVPVKSELDIRTFKCVVCERVDIIAVNLDS